MRKQNFPHVSLPRVDPRIRQCINAESQRTGNPRQDRLEQAASNASDPQIYAQLVEHARSTARNSGIDETFKTHDINVLLAPAESALMHFAAAAGPSLSLSIEWILSITFGQMQALTQEGKQATPSRHCL